MDLAVVKTCCVCGIDVRQLKRTKDPRGNYYCRPCYETKLQEYRKRAARPRSAVALPLRPPAIPSSRAPSMKARIESPDPHVSHKSPFERNFGWAGIMAWLSNHGRGGESNSVQLSEVHHDATEVQPSKAIEQVDAQRRIGSSDSRRSRGARRMVRVSDLLSPEALAQAQAANRYGPTVEPEIPASPPTNPPVTALLRVNWMLSSELSHTDSSRHAS